MKTSTLGQVPHLGATDHHPGSVPCPCGQSCLSCEAAWLGTTCGCEFEAKQFEYALAERTRAHNHHAAGHGMGEAHDHEAMMTHPRMAAFMETDLWRLFLWSLVLT